MPAATRPPRPASQPASPLSPPIPLLSLTARSPTLPPQVLATIKNAMLILLAMALYAEVVTMTQAVGYAISMAAFGAYTYLKMNQISAQTAPGSS